MAVSPFTAEEAYQRLRAYLEANSPLRGFYRGSVNDTLLRAFSFIIDDTQFQIANVVDLFSIDRCGGADLDKRATDFYGCPARLTAAAASGVGKFHRTFPLEDGGPELTEAITIAAGAVVSAPETELSNALKYRTTETAIIPAGSYYSNSVNFAAFGTGTAYNVVADEVSTLETAVSGVDSFANTYDVVNGRELETDEEFRQRIKRWVLGLSRATAPALVQAATSIRYTQEGTSFEERITSANIVELDTPGRVLVYVDNGSGTPSDEIVQLVQQELDGDVTDWISHFGVRAGGVRATVMRPTVSWISIGAAVSIKDIVGVNETAVLAAVRRSASAHVNNLWAGDDVVYNHLLTDMFNASPDFIEDISLTMNGGTGNISVSQNMIAKSRSSDIVIQ
jgi:hypothetical protein